MKLEPVVGLLYNTNNVIRVVLTMFTHPVLDII